MHFSFRCFGSTIICDPHAFYDNYNPVFLSALVFLHTSLKNSLNSLVDCEQKATFGLLLCHVFLVEYSFGILIDNLHY